MACGSASVWPVCYIWNRREKRATKRERRGRGREKRWDVRGARIREIARHSFSSGPGYIRERRGIRHKYVQQLVRGELSGSGCPSPFRGARNAFDGNIYSRRVASSDRRDYVTVIDRLHFWPALFRNGGKETSRAFSSQYFKNRP